MSNHKGDVDRGREHVLTYPVMLIPVAAKGKKRRGWCDSSRTALAWAGRVEAKCRSWCSPRRPMPLD